MKEKERDIIMTKQEKQQIRNAFDPFLQPFEKEHMETWGGLKVTSQFDARKFSSEQCMDFYKAFDAAMNSDNVDDEDIKFVAMEAGKSAYHYLTHGDIEMGDGERIANSYMVGTTGPKPFDSFYLDHQQNLFYELAKGVRIKEQLNILKKSGNILKKAAAMSDVPMPYQYNVLCEAVRIDEALQDPSHFLSNTLAFERPGNLEKVIKSRRESLHEYLDKNGLPHDYEALKADAESWIKEPVNELVDLSPKTQWDVPFDQICEKAHENGMPVDAFDATRSAVREAWLIDRIEPGARKNELVESFFKRVYDTIHQQDPGQVTTGKPMSFPSGLGKELKSERTFVNMRVMGSTKNADFLKGYAAYEEMRENENLTLTDDDLRGIKNSGPSL